SSAQRSEVAVASALEVFQSRVDLFQAACDRAQQQVHTSRRSLHWKGSPENNVFVLDFVPDLDGIVTFTSWTHPLDLDPDFSPEGFWYSHTIPETERTRALAKIQHSAAAKTISTAAETTPEAAETTSAAAETTAAAAATSTPIAGPSTASAQISCIDDTPPTPAQQLNPTP
ncbi:unnamed protein product, partial [Closterium sp. NIES-54]